MTTGGVTCPACGHVMEGRQRYCSRCGRPLPEKDAMRPTPREHPHTGPSSQAAILIGVFLACLLALTLALMSATSHAAHGGGSVPVSQGLQQGLGTGTLQMISRVVHASGDVYEYTYDDRGRPLREHRTRNAATDETYLWTFSADDLTATLRNPDGIVTTTFQMSYDQTGQLAQMQQYSASGALHATYVFSYRTTGTLERMEAVMDGHTQTVTFDEHGNTSSSIDEEGNGVSYATTLDASGHPAHVDIAPVSAHVVESPTNFALTCDAWGDVIAVERSGVLVAELSYVRIEHPCSFAVTYARAFNNAIEDFRYK